MSENGCSARWQHEAADWLQLSAVLVPLVAFQEAVCRVVAAPPPARGVVLPSDCRSWCEPWGPLKSECTDMVTF